MLREKFDETDRRAVVSTLERELKIKLQRVGTRRKWFRDNVGRNYWILGGYGEWHGIPEDMMQDEVEASAGGFVVVANRQRSSIQIHIGPLSTIVESKDKLYRATKTGDYQFTFKKRGDLLIIGQIPSATLRHVIGFSFNERQKAGVAKIENAERLFAQLPEEERRRMIESLAQQTIATDRAKPRSG